MIAYLATSAFGHLYRKIDCTAGDIGALRKAIYSRTVSIPLGLHNLEEIVLAPSVSPQAMAAQLRLLLSISSWRVLMKPCGQLLADDLRSFAAGAEPARPFLRGAMQNAVTTGISALLESDGEELNEDFAQALDEVRREREAFAAGLSEFLAEYGTRFTPPSNTGDFEDYFERTRRTAAAALAERAGVGAGMQAAWRRGATRAEERQDVGGRGAVARLRAKRRGTAVARRGDERGHARGNRRRGGGDVRHRRRARATVAGPRRDRRAANDGP